LLSIGGGNHLCSCVDNLEEKNNHQASSLLWLGANLQCQIFSVKANFFFPFVFRACTLGQMETSNAALH
jgi:hypothetical protein